MNVSAKTRMFRGFLVANACIALVAVLILLNRPPAPPLIQGVLLPEARALQSFELLDHHNRVFDNEALKGRWHIVSYGFTTCPDICPTTLNQLVSVSNLLEAQGRENDLRVLFYSVDHRRDTVDQLASYMPFFNKSFVGLTHADDSENPHLPFEKGLGIVAQLVPKTGDDVNPADNEYEVNHGVTLFLLNPEGKLQAIFEPDYRGSGFHTFSPERVVQDYLEIRDYLG
ncbi:SCO family protein [Candidatus Marimicrobium litorale]|uniref:SCO family protein n=1 Tax=Candidatus Marimicrobium litorale TaxID=2518991 RepID=A0ABT3T8B2_9GAMM|nr:SCO family protein [Candidatus Marimicrobium litorale]MCX2978061.1 SCO family protein [Candidatus Marimicrobium litorale]